MEYLANLLTRNALTQINIYLIMLDFSSEGL